MKKRLYRRRIEQFEVKFVVPVKMTMEQEMDLYGLVADYFANNDLSVESPTMTTIFSKE